MEKSIEVWNIITDDWDSISKNIGLKNQKLFGHSDIISCLVKIDNDTIVSASLDNTMKLWNLLVSKCLLTFKSNSKPIHCLLKLNKNQIASGSQDNSIKVWDFSQRRIHNVTKMPSGRLHN